MTTMTTYTGTDATAPVIHATTHYTLTDDGGATKDIEAESLADAREQAEDWARDGSYDDRDSTIWVDTRIEDEDGETVDTVTTQIDPTVPDCIDSKTEHAWQAPVGIVGGCEENPGVHGHGGGALIDECCMRCGCRRRTDTWAQRPDTGEQGLCSVEYAPNFYTDELPQPDDEVEAQS